MRILRLPIVRARVRVYGHSNSVATGTDVLGRETDQGDVLYLALEDNERRLQDRLKKILNGRDVPSCLTFVTDIPRLDKGGQEQIFDWIDSHPNARMVVIDVWGKISPSKNRNQDDYDFITHALGPLAVLGVSATVQHFQQQTTCKFRR